MEKILQDLKGKQVKIITVTGSQPALPDEGTGMVEDVADGVVTLKRIRHREDLPARLVHIAINRIVWVEPLKG